MEEKNQYTCKNVQERELQSSYFPEKKIPYLVGYSPGTMEEKNQYTCKNVQERELQSSYFPEKKIPYLVGYSSLITWCWKIKKKQKKPQKT